MGGEEGGGGSNEVDGGEAWEVGGVGVDVDMGKSLGCRDPSLDAAAAAVVGLHLKHSFPGVVVVPCCH